MVKKQTPLTLEAFEEVIMPQIDEKFEDFEIKINHLPTKEEFFSRMDKVMGELQKLRDEVIIVNHQYERTNKRVDKVDKHLNISTAEV